MRSYKTIWLWLGFSLLCAWRIVYAYWTPLVNRYLVPPGDDATFHVARVADLLFGQHRFFYTDGYPLGFHALVAIGARIADWDALTAIRLLGPLVLILPLCSLLIAGRLLFGSYLAGMAAVALWILLALAPIRAYGDGNYPNLLGASFLLPLAIGLLYRASQSRTINWKLLASLAVTILALVLTHHLSAIFFALALVPFLLWSVWRVLANWQALGGRAVPLGLLAASLLLAAVIFWPIFGAPLVPYLTAFIASGSFQTTLGTFTQSLTFGQFLEIHNPLFVLFGLFGLVGLISSNEDRRLKILMTGWIGLFLLFAFTPLVGLPGRFARELAIPFALVGGWGVTFLAQRAATVRLAQVGLIILLLIVGYDFSQSFARAYALPDPYRSLMRVQHDEEPAIAALKTLTLPGATILTNNSNPYLSFLVEQPIEIITKPTDTQKETGATILYLGARPPLTPVEVYPFFAYFDEIKEGLESRPNIELLAEFPTGSKIYKITNTELEN